MDEERAPGMRTKRSVRAVPLVAAGFVIATALLAGCGSGSDGRERSGDGARDEGPELSTQARRGMELTRTNGCTACHSADGGDSIGPTWAGLHGSTVTLEDGASATVDEEYLTRAIEDPNAQVRQGFRPIMPERRLPEADVAAVVAYLVTLGTEGGPADGGSAGAGGDGS